MNMDFAPFMKAFEVGVSAALELFSKADLSQTRQQLADSAKQVLEATSQQAAETIKKIGK